MLLSTTPDFNTVKKYSTPSRLLRTGYWIWSNSLLLSIEMIGQLCPLIYWCKISSCYCCCHSVTKLCLTLCDPMNCKMPGLPVLHHLPEFIQTHVHWVSDTIQPPHPLLPSSPLALNLSHHQSLFQPVSSSHQVAKRLELQLQHVTLCLISEITKLWNLILFVIF